MKITQEVQNDIIILQLEGNVMGGPEAVEINEEVNRLLDEGAFKLVIDLSGVHRMNSSGLGILINARATYEQNGGQIKLANLTPVVQKLFKITRLNTIFELYPSLQEALNSF